MIYVNLDALTNPSDCVVLTLLSQINERLKMGDLHIEEARNPRAASEYNKVLRSCRVCLNQLTSCVADCTNLTIWCHLDCIGENSKILVSL